MTHGARRTLSPRSATRLAEQGSGTAVLVLLEQLDYRDSAGIGELVEGCERTDSPPALCRHARDRQRAARALDLRRPRAAVRRNRTAGECQATHWCDQPDRSTHCAAPGGTAEAPVSERARSLGPAGPLRRPRAAEPPDSTVPLGGREDLAGNQSERRMYDGGRPAV
jgi:hypothetical protein